MSFQNRYGLLDRLLHRLAFATPGAQRGVADLEQRMFKKELEAVDLGPPVLVTALPRAGTTILLELLAATPEFAAHTYRDTPFVLCPMMWARLSKPFQRDQAARERAHGDGIEVGPDSPEAFEEMLWKAFFPRHYEARRIAPWRRCEDEEFREFFAAHRRKVVALRRRSTPTKRRYVSKNNANIARLPAVWDAVPDAAVVVPFREPLQHAASLLRQHLRFCEMHDQDAFARRYMAGIGHHDFGHNLLPIDFGGWLGERDLDEARGLGFWLDYWVASYRHVLAQLGDERLHLVCFETLGAATDLSRLAAAIGADAGALAAQTSRLRPARAQDVDVRSAPEASAAAARELYELLRPHAVA